MGLFAHIKEIRTRYSKNLDNKPIVISGVFGNEYLKLHHSPEGFRCILFTNNVQLRGEAKLKGWEFMLLDGKSMGLASDAVISSLQSKYVKFLIFSDDNLNKFSGHPILYIDHKVAVTKEHVDFISSKILPSKSILIRNTPRLKSSIWDEIQDAMLQDRYAKAMPETISWLEKMKNERGISEIVRIMNTGLIYYREIDSVRSLLDEVYEVSQSLAQPECQIIFAALSQPYEHLIQRVSWKEIGIDHQIP